MLNLKRHYNKYRVTYVGQRYRLDVDSLAEVAQVTLHYYTPGDDSHKPSECPVCKDLERRRK